MIDNKLMTLAGLLFYILPMIMAAVDQRCNYSQNMTIGASYYAYNMEYPKYYRGPIECLWKAVAPQGYQIEIDCTLKMPQSNSCTQDKLQISLNGDTNFGKAYTYCGSGNVTTLITEDNSIAIGLKVPSNSAGGNFLCSFKTKEKVVPTCDCGSKNVRRIVGGTETQVNEFPMMAALIDYQVRELFCGATIIANRYAVTAAHCMKKKFPIYTGLLVGDHNIATSSDSKATQLHNTIEFKIHPMYDPDNAKAPNDIAIIKTEKMIEFNTDVGPACLPFTNYQNSFSYDYVDALGWGTTEFTGPKSDVLLRTDLKILGYDECYNREGGIIDQMCTYTPGHDSCQSDSGGPLLWMDPSSSKINLVGIISSGYGCASKHAGLNTRITSYILWITSVTPDASYCVK